jgi:very-short-patch-repair endonuclease
MFNCPRCIKEFDSYNGLSRHTAKSYGLKGEQLYREYHGITEIVTCKCGCGTPTKLRTDTGYNDYVAGHNSIGSTNPMFGNTHSDTARKNISSKRKEKFANGEYEIWQHKTGEKYDLARQKIADAVRKENNPERARKISQSLKGVPKSAEHSRKSRIGIKKAWENSELRERQRINILNRFLSKKKNNPSRLEMTFEKLLLENGIKYQTQFNLSHRLYDFKLENSNILIEVDGDFYHANPKKYPTPICKTQEDVIKNDHKKNEIAQHSGYTLLRFWESDILNNPQQVITELLAEIKKTSP